MKKAISFLIILSLLLGSFPPLEKSYAASYQVKEWNYPGFDKLTEYQKSLIDQLFIQKVKLQNKKGMYIAIKPLESQHVTVYNWNHLTAKGFGQEGPFKGLWVDGKLIGAGEYRYLGYDYNGNPVTNDKYTNGPVVGNRDVYDLPDYKYFTQPNAFGTWENGVNTETTTHMLQKEFASEDEFRDTNPKHWSMKNLLSKTITGTRLDEPAQANNIPNNSLKPYLIMQTPASLNEKGSMRAYGKGKNANGELVTSYNTFNVEPIDKTFKHGFAIIAYEDKACTKVANKIEIPQDKESVKVYVKLNSNIDMDPIKLKGQETKYIEWVTHTLIVNADVNNARKVDVKDLSVTQKVNNICEVTLNKKDYSAKPKSIHFKGISTPKIRYAMMRNITAEASTNIEVSVQDPTKLTANFTIHHGTENKTDDIISIDTQTISTPIALALKDASTVPDNNAVVNYNWFVYNHTKNDIDYFGYTKDTSFTIDSTNKDAYIKEGAVTFREMVVDKVGNREWAEHKVSILPKNSKDSAVPPAEVLPKAIVAAPGTIRAGQRCGISGEGTSANGLITEYAFDLASNFQLIQDSMKHKEGTFLSFDHSTNNDWSERTKLTVTDTAGKTATDEVKTLVKHPIDPVFKTRGVYKVHRTIQLDATESTGTEYYPIDKITWTIKPMDGQSINVVKPHVTSKVTGNTMTVEGAAPKVDFKQLGRYEVWMDVHSTCTFPGETHRTASKQVYGIITIAPDEVPIAKLSVPRVTIRDYDDANQANITIWDESYSPDGDTIGKRKYYVRQDTDNDKQTSDETWRLVYEGTNSSVDYKTPYVGYYEFKVEVEEANDSNTSPFWNAATDTLKANSDPQALVEKQTEVLNVAPITSIMAERKKLDLILVTDYQGADYSALKSELDLLTKDLFEKGVDIHVQVFTDKLKNGSVKAPIYRYTRYSHVYYTCEFTQNSSIQYQTRKMDDRFAWESKLQLETDYLPTYSPVPATYSTSSSSNPDPAGGIYVNNILNVTINAPTDPYLKCSTKKITEELVYSNQYNSGLEKRQNIRDMSVAVDGNFVKEDIVGYQDIDLYTMNLELLRNNIGYREGSDRQMVFVMKTGDSLTTLNQAFADYIKQNKVVVSAINGFDMTSQYGGLAVQNAEFIYTNQTAGDKPSQSYMLSEWISKQRAYSEPIGVAFKTEDGKSYSVASYKDINFPTVLSGYTFRNSENEYRAYANWKTFYGDGSSYQEDAGHQTVPYDYKMNDYELKVLSDFNTYNNQEKVIVRGTKTRRGEEYDYEYEAPMGYGPAKKMEIAISIDDESRERKAYFIRNGNLYRYDIPANGTFDQTLAGAKLEAENCEFAFVGDRMYAEYGPFSSIIMINYKTQNKTRIIWQTQETYTGSRGDSDVYYRFNEAWVDGTVKLAKYYQTGPTREPNEQNSLYERNVYANPTIDILTSTGVAKRLTTEFYKPSKSYNKTVMHIANIPNGFKSMAVTNTGRRNFSDYYQYWGSTVKVYKDTESSNSSYFMSQEGDIWKTNGYWDGNGNLYFSQVTQGLNIKEFNIYAQQSEGYSTMHLLALTHDGKLLSAPVGNQILTPQNMTNIVKDPRTLSQPVVNAMSMRKLLNQSSANRISGSFGAFGTQLRADYDYLKYQVKTTLLLGETLKYEQLYYDMEGDTLHESAMQINHDPNALESPIGTDVNHNKTLSNWDAKLTKTGLYKIQPKVKDSPSADDRFSDYRLWNKDDTTLEVLVHRKPIASMKLSMTPTAPFVLTARDSMSKDLDHISQPHRGITEVEWGIKKLYDDAWEISRGPLNTSMTKALETGETYIVSYRVKDVEGEWSDPVTEQIVAGMNLLLDAKLKPENPEHSLTKFQTGNNVIFHDLWTSYPLAHHLEIQMYDGQTPILGKVTLRKESNHVRTENYPERDWQDVGFNIPRAINGVPLADKTYSFVVTAFDSSNPNIKKQKTFQVTTVSNSAPTVSFTRIEPSTLYEGDKVQVSLKVDDPDNDRLNLQVYITYDGQAEKLLETHQNVAAGSTIVLKAFELPKAKLLKLRAVVTDPMNATGEAKAERAIQALGIETATLTGAWNHWRGQVNAFGQQMSNEPYRFLAYEKVSMTITTRGEPDQLSLRLEAPLEAMRYVDSKGNVYTYKEEIGSDVSFPIIFRKIAANKYYLEYILPLANSTISWEGQRKRPPYQLYVTLTKDGRSRLVVFGDEAGEVCIDMTGNIFDLVYNQPTKPKK